MFGWFVIMMIEMIYCDLFMPQQSLKQTHLNPCLSILYASKQPKTNPNPPLHCEIGIKIIKECDRYTSKPIWKQSKAKSKRKVSLQQPYVFDEPEGKKQNNEKEWRPYNKYYQ